MIQKINPKTNVLTWFEIPVRNMERAQTFYETLLDIKMETMKGQDGVVFFPRLPDTIMAQSGILSGSLVKSDKLKPSINGPLIYLNAYPSIDDVIDRLRPAGGTLIGKKTKIPAGFIAIFKDTEGNRLALHAEK